MAQATKGNGPATRRDVDRVVGRFLGYSPLSQLLPSFPELGFPGAQEFSPDIYETEEELIFVAPLPGVRAEDLHIEATADTLSIKGEGRPFYTNEKAKHLRHSQLPNAVGAFQANYALPFEIDAEKVQANFRNGVLELHLPRVAPVKPKAFKVDVQAE